jgi:hypothetical protein
MMIGAWKFDTVRLGTRMKGKREFHEQIYRCPRCKKELFESSITKHLESHDRRAEKSDMTRIANDLGITRPIPGQLGLAALGIGEVVARAPSKRRATR